MFPPLQYFIFCHTISNFDFHSFELCRPISYLVAFYQFLPFFALLSYLSERRHFFFPLSSGYSGLGLCYGFSFFLGLFPSPNFFRRKIVGAASLAILFFSLPVFFPDIPLVKCMRAAGTIESLWRSLSTTPGNHVAVDPCFFFLVRMQTTFCPSLGSCLPSLSHSFFFL